MRTNKSTLKSGMVNPCPKILIPFLLFIILTGFITAVYAQAANKISTSIAPYLLKKDFSIFRDSLEKLHPGLYRYKDKKQISRLFKSCEVKLSLPMDLLQYYAIIRFAISGIEDGHTSAFLPQEINKLLISQAKIFPLWLRFIHEKAYITHDTKDLLAGTEIISINHVGIKKLRKLLFAYIPSDGKTQSGKYADMNEGESPLLYLYYLVFGEKSSFNISFITPGGKKGNMQLRADQFKNVEGRPTPPKVTQYLKLAYTKDSVAVLTVKTFLNDFLDKTHENFAAFMQSSFKEIANKSIKKLIIDVRDNTGGHDNNGSLLASYLTDKPFKYFASIRTTTQELTAANNDLLGVLQPAENNFKGKVYILINGKCFSTTADFCAIAQNISNAQFIGEETGGGYYGNTSGARATLMLPNTGIKVNIPLCEYFDAVKPLQYKDRGVIPNYQVVPAVSDILQNKDVQMAFALNLTESNF